MDDKDKWSYRQETESKKDDTDPIDFEEMREKFISYYVMYENATRAAKEAGYAHASSQGSRLLKLLRPEIRKRMNDKNSKRIAKEDEVLRFLTDTMRGEKVDRVISFPTSGVSDIENIQIEHDVKPASKDRLRAAEMLGKRFGIFTDKVELTGEDNPISVLIGELKGDSRD